MPWGILTFKQVVGDRSHDSGSLGEGVQGIGGGGEAHVASIFERHRRDLNPPIVTFSPWVLIPLMQDA